MNEPNKNIRPENDEKDQDIKREFPGEEIINSDGTTQFPSERDTSTEAVNPDDQSSKTTESGLEQTERDYEGVTDVAKNSAEEAGEAQGLTAAEDDASLEEYIENDQKRQGGGISVKASNEPLGRPQQDGEESENV